LIAPKCYLVYIHEKDRSSGECRQQIDIHFNFIGEFKIQKPEPELTPEEQAEAEKKRAKKLYLREYHKAWRDKKKEERETAKANAEVIALTDDNDGAETTPKPAA
jgi:hypothetical protein